jgi:PAS domain S-box-containing protein
MYRTYRWALTIAALVIFGYFTFLTAPFDLELRGLASQGGMFLGGIVGIAALLFRYRLSSGRRRRAWALMSAGLGLALVANLWIYAIGPLGFSDDMTIYGDAAILLGLCLGVAALISFPSRARRGTEAARMILDGIVVGGSALYIVAVTVFPDLLPEGDSLSPRSVILLLIPVADAALATMAVLLVLKSHKVDRPALVLLSSGVILYSIADVTYAVRNARGEWDFGTAVDLLWIAGYALFTLAALHPANQSRPGDERRSEPASVVGTLLVFSLFFMAAVLTISPSEHRDVTRYAGIMWIGVLVAVAARQILYVVDNRALRLSLEQRVQARTAELSKLTEQSELLLSSVGEGIYGVDRHGLVTFANPAAAHILGCKPEDLIGLPAHDGWHDVQEDGTPYPVEDCYVTEAIRSGIRTHVAEDVYRRKDGSTIPVEVTASPLSSAEGIQGAVVVFRDVSHRREVDRMKNEFVSVVSHELRTPLTAIRGSLGLLAGGALGELPARAGRMVAIALESSERLTRLINDILDLERIEAGTTPMDLADHSVAALVDGAIEQMGVIASGAGVKLRVVRANGTVRANADRVIQTLVNLLGNAIKFSPAGTAVSIAADELPDGNEIEFSVSDQGRGIPVDKLESIFKRFDQVDSSDAREKGGTGLGLAICKSIVERHGGHIWVTSKIDAGSTFSFTLPRAAAPSHRRIVHESQPAVAVRGIDRAGADAMCRALAARGYSSVPLLAGDSLGSLIDGNPPAALVVDVGQSRADTARAIATLRGDPTTRGVAVVVRSRWHPEDLPLIAAHANGWVLTDDSEHLARTVTAAIVGQRALGDVLVIEDTDGLSSELHTLLEHRGLTVCHPGTSRGALAECGPARPHVLILDGQIPNSDVVAITAELREGGLMEDIPVVVYAAPGAATGTGDDLRLGRTLFLDANRVSAAGVDSRIAELLGTMAPGR